MTKFLALNCLKTRNLILCALGSLVLAFGIYNVHSVSGITEGGILGLILLFEKHFSLSPALSSVVLNAACYIFGFFVMGFGFVVYSAFSSLCFSAFYAIIELFPPIIPDLSEMPLIAAIVGAIFVGVGAGLCVGAGAASSGDDALAMGFSKLFSIKIERIYLISDISVLALSLSYIPFSKITYSVITVILSGKLVGIIQRRLCK